MFRAMATMVEPLAAMSRPYGVARQRAKCAQPGAGAERRQLGSRSLTRDSVVGSKVPALLARQQELAAAGVSLVLVAVLDDDESVDDAAAALQAWGAPAPFLTLGREQPPGLTLGA
jgi:hypothetical protein